MDFSHSPSKSSKSLEINHNTNSSFLPKSEIIYCLIASLRTPKILILAEYYNMKQHQNQNQVNYQKTVLEIVQKHFSKDPTDAKLSIPVGKEVYHLLIIEKIVFICLSEVNFGKNMSFIFLKDVSKDFFSKYNSENYDFESQSIAVGNECRIILHQKVSKYSSTAVNNNLLELEPVNKIQNQLDGVTDIMKKNIEKVIDRGDKIDLLFDKTDVLSDYSNQFLTRSRRLRRNMCWQKFKFFLVIFGIVMVFIIIILISVCGFNMYDCLTD